MYSPAKKRGPVPGRVNQTRKYPDEEENANMGGLDPSSMQQQILSGRGGFDEAALRQVLLQQQAMGGLSNAFSATENSMLVGSGAPLLDTSGGAVHLQQLNYLPLGNVHAPMHRMSLDGDVNMTQGRSRRVKTEEDIKDLANSPDTVAAHMTLLSRDSLDGNRLRAFYRLSVDELYCLPPIPTDEDYCAIHDFSPDLLPQSHKHALNAARFAELALGAIVHNETALATELSNASVHCLRNCMQGPRKAEYTFEVARAYFLLGAFRAFRGDMLRYFKYRRVSMTHLARLEVSSFL